MWMCITDFGYRISQKKKKSGTGRIACRRLGRTVACQMYLSRDLFVSEIIGFSILFCNPVTIDFVLLAC